MKPPFTMNDHSSLSASSSPRFRGEVLRRIWRTWFIRRFLPVLVAEVVGLTLFAYWLAHAVFVRRILENALNVFFDNPTKVVEFVIFAFLYASIAVKVLAFTVLILLTLLVWKIGKALGRYAMVKQRYFAKAE